MSKKELNRELKCPKCSSKNIGVTEISEAERIWQIEDNSIDEDDAMTDIGFVLRVDGRCWDCKHIWKLRNITQITDLFKDDVVVGVSEQ